MIESNDFNLEQEEKILSTISNFVGVETFKPGLDRLRPIFERVKSEVQKRNIKIVTVGGTNGKGETCFFLSQYLEQSNKKWAVWSSPHVLSVRERFFINNKLISYKKLIDLVNQHQHLKNELSYYEFLFYIFWDHALAADLDVIILEVGLGGRFDAVNLFDPILTCITSISRDHQEILGNSLQKILIEKMGILRDETYLVTGIEQLSLVRNLKKECEKKNISANYIERNSNYSQMNQDMAYELACKLIEKTKLSLNDNLLPKLKGRLEDIHFDGEDYFFLGAHNPDGFKKMMQRLEGSKKSFDRVIVSFSNRSEEDIRSCLKTLLLYPCVAGQIILTSFAHHKGVKLGLLKDICYSISVKKENPELEFEADWKKILVKKQSSVLITGSYYFIGEVQKHIHSLKCSVSNEDLL